MGILHTIVKVYALLEVMKTKKHCHQLEGQSTILSCSSAHAVLPSVQPRSLHFALMLAEIQWMVDDFRTNATVLARYGADHCSQPPTHPAVAFSLVDAQLCLRMKSIFYRRILVDTSL